MDSFTESNPNPDSDLANRIRSKIVEKRKNQKVNNMTPLKKVPIPLVNRGARVKRGFSGYPNAIHNPNGI